jgi:hypothetical protein
MEPCNFCLGKTKGNCGPCEGNGVHSCTECDGGYVYRYKEKRYQDECHSCNGEGRHSYDLICRHCGGRGWKFYTDLEPINGTGKKCMYCNGTDEIFCETCKGTGDILKCECTEEYLEKIKKEKNDRLFTFFILILTMIILLLCELWELLIKK